MKVGDLVTNEYGSIFLVIFRSKTKKSWRRKIYVYSPATGVLEFTWKYATSTLIKIA